MNAAHEIRKLLIGLAVLALCGVCAVAQQDSSPAAQSSTPAATTSADASHSNSSQLRASDRRFVKKAAEGGMAEVELGQLAQEKASSFEVKQFAKRMVTDHSKANDELKQIASSKGVTLPSRLSAKDKATKEKLSNLSGKDFDNAYMRDMVKDHTKDVAEFQKESTSAHDPAVKNFASQTLPTLQIHLKDAKEIGPKTTASASKP